MILIDEVTGDIDYPMKMTKEQAISTAMAACFAFDQIAAMRCAGREVEITAITMRKEEEDEKHTD